MRRIVFAGPSIHGLANDWPHVEIRPPARQGDMYAAALDGAEWIGLIDGVFGMSPSVWHKEILFALANGVHVWGAASMGALRASECSVFGMVPIGGIAQAYAAGKINDDAEVALLHGPAEVSFMPFTEPMVEVRATLEAMHEGGCISTRIYQRLLEHATDLHFSERTLDALLGDFADDAHPQAGTAAEAKNLFELYERYRSTLKSDDASLLLAAMAGSLPATLHLDWKLAESGSMQILRGL